MEMCQARGKAYGIVVKRLDFPSSATFEELRRMIGTAGQSGGRPTSPPILAYRVFADGHEELVRGLRFRGIGTRTLRDIQAASDDMQLFEFLDNSYPLALLGAGGYVAESAVVAPSVLIDDIELQKIDEELPKTPIVPAP